MAVSSGNVIRSAMHAASPALASFIPNVGAGVALNPCGGILPDTSGPATAPWVPGLIFDRSAERRCGSGSSPEDCGSGSSADRVRRTQEVDPTRVESGGWWKWIRHGSSPEDAGSGADTGRVRRTQEVDPTRVESGGWWKWSQYGSSPESGGSGCEEAAQGQSRQPRDLSTPSNHLLKAKRLLSQ